LHATVQGKQLNTSQQSMVTMMNGQRDVIGCGSDPRPEGVLLHDKADPRGPKGK